MEKVFEKGAWSVVDYDDGSQAIGVNYDEYRIPFEDLIALLDAYFASKAHPAVPGDYRTSAS